MNKTFMAFLKILLTGGVILLFAFFIQKDILKLRTFLTQNPIAHSLKIEHDKVKSKAIAMTINHYRPDLSLWKDFIIDGKMPDKTFLRDSVYYYELIDSYVPQNPEVHHFLGLCYFLSGDFAKALFMQERTVILEPRFFWGWYNLGVMYYQQGDFNKSARALDRALSLPPQATLKILGDSRIYGEVLHSTGTVERAGAPDIQQGYQDARVMLNNSIRHLRGLRVDPKDEQVRLKLF